MDHVCPFDLRVDSVGAFLNAELPDHPVYEGFEVQWFDDEVHGTGMLAFLQRREDHRVDYYVEPGLEIDRGAFELGGGTGRWVETSFEANHLVVDDGGVVADVRFADVDGRPIEVRIDDRDAGPRRGGVLLAPVSAAIEAPTSLLLVYVHDFDLIRQGQTEPTVLIDGEPASTGRLPGARWHRRHLVKAGANLSVVSVCPDGDGPLEGRDPEAAGGAVDDRTGIRRRVATHLGVTAELMFEPSVPSVTELEDGARVEGEWQVTVDGATLTGGRWGMQRLGGRVEARMIVTRRWRPPPGQPLLVRIVTRVVPTFRRWPTTYRWLATITLDEQPWLTSRWERTTADRGGDYRAATTR